MTTSRPCLASTSKRKRFGLHRSGVDDAHFGQSFVRAVRGEVPVGQECLPAAGIDRNMARRRRPHTSLA